MSYWLMGDRGFVGLQGLLKFVRNRCSARRTFCTRSTYRLGTKKPEYILMVMSAARNKSEDKHELKKISITPHLMT